MYNVEFFTCMPHIHIGRIASLYFDSPFAKACKLRVFLFTHFFYFKVGMELRVKEAYPSLRHYLT